MNELNIQFFAEQVGFFVMSITWFLTAIAFAIIFVNLKGEEKHLRYPNPILKFLGFTTIIWISVWIFLLIFFAILDIIFS
ncbi:MAG: hypothetical protein VYC50_01295 [Pseudomonadota bacterium]|nr:hypothetical protein [Gammaproteobacteria bacterium]MEE2683725.1 hypothetical protein [Pseudomonadota bacterium]|tara:strand:- start:3501 stop:3740 length:240 start_codon:yes stop_codon:yes gene_type:complete